MFGEIIKKCYLGHAQPYRFTPPHPKCEKWSIQEGEVSPSPKVLPLVLYQNCPPVVRVLWRLRITAWLGHTKDTRTISHR